MEFIIVQWASNDVFKKKLFRNYLFNGSLTLSSTENYLEIIGLTLLAMGG